MLYALSVYLLYGFIGVFLGGICGPVIAIVGHSLVVPAPVGDRASGDFGAAFDLMGLGFVVGAAIGIVAGLLYAYRTLRAQRIRAAQQTQSRADVWPPPPTGTA